MKRVLLLITLSAFVVPSYANDLAITDWFGEQLFGAGSTLDLLPQIRSHGHLDVVVGDDSVADFYQLVVHRAFAVPAVPGAGRALAALLLVAAFGVLRRTGRRRGRGAG